MLSGNNDEIETSHAVEMQITSKKILSFLILHLWVREEGWPIEDDEATIECTL